MEKTCIFCKIANGEIPSATIYEDEDFRVILDVNPASRGHALILTKAHYTDVYELTNEQAGKVFILAKEIVTKLTNILGCDGYNITQNNGEAAGQTVFHFHMHLIPRLMNDGVGVHWKMGKLEDKDAKFIISEMSK